MTELWKSNWEQAVAHHRQWWLHEGLVITGGWSYGVSAAGHAAVPAPGPARSLEQRYTDSAWRAAHTRHRLSRTYFGADTLPMASTDIGPGSLATMLGSEPGWADDTVWFNPCLGDPEADTPIVFNPENHWWQVHRAIIEANVALSDGNYMVGCPDLVENIDILASLRGAQVLLMDMIERPAWVKRRLREINQAFFQVYDRIYELIKRPDGCAGFGAFHLYGQGRTAKVQCDASAMFSPAMFAEFVVPCLREQCEWLDYSMYHLDGTGCIGHLDHLLGIEALDAIEWTPESLREPHGSHRKWWPMYRRILDAGKSVQVVAAKKAEVVPMIEALGSKGLYIMVSDFESAEDVDALYQAVERFR